MASYSYVPDNAQGIIQHKSVVRNIISIFYNPTLLGGISSYTYSGTILLHI